MNIKNGYVNKIKNMYIHLPFCKKKCSFCDFSVYATGLSEDKLKIDHTKKIYNDYVSYLLKDIDFYS